MKKALLLAVVAFAVLQVMSEKAFAIPAFARKYKNELCDVPQWFS